MLYLYWVIYMDEINQLKSMIEDSHYIVFFGGAGVSTQSGIPDFRSKDGLYHQTYAYPPEQILSHSFFLEHTDEFFHFYREKLNCLQATPNTIHYKLAELEKQGKLKAIITQNIDGLHQKAGSKQVYELHGSILRNYCMKCHRFFDASYMLHSAGVPKCECGGVIKPDVVLYEEGLDESVISGAVSAISAADTLIIGGTSLVVYPAAGLIRYFRGNNLILINKSHTSADSNADMVIHDSIEKVLYEAVIAIR